MRGRQHREKFSVQDIAASFDNKKQMLVTCCIEDDVCERRRHLVERVCSTARNTMLSQMILKENNRRGEIKAFGNENRGEESRFEKLIGKGLGVGN